MSNRHKYGLDSENASERVASSFWRLQFEPQSGIQFTIVHVLDTRAFDHAAAVVISPAWHCWRALFWGYLGLPTLLPFPSNLGAVFPRPCAWLWLLSSGVLIKASSMFGERNTYPLDALYVAVFNVSVPLASYYVAGVWPP